MLPLKTQYKLQPAVVCECEKDETVIFSKSEEEEVAESQSGEQMASPSVWSV